MQVLISDMELDHLAELQDAWQEYVERVRSIGLQLEQASAALRDQLVQDSRAFDQRCAEHAAQMHGSAPYDGEVRRMCAAEEKLAPVQNRIWPVQAGADKGCARHGQVVGCGTGLGSPTPNLCMQAWTHDTAVAELRATRERLAQLCKQEEELHFGLRLFQLAASHNRDLGACEHVRLLLMGLASVPAAVNARPAVPLMHAVIELRLHLGGACVADSLVSGAPAGAGGVAAGARVGGGPALARRAGAGWQGAVCRYGRAPAGEDGHRHPGQPVPGGLCVGLAPAQAAAGGLCGLPEAGHCLKRPITL